MKLFYCVLLLGIGAQGQQIPGCQSAKLYYNGVLADEEPRCGPLLQVVHMPTALDDITRAEFAEDAQRAADETDGKPYKKWKAASCDQPGMTCTTGFSTHPFIPPPAESAVDVPAVQEQQAYKTGDSSCKAAPECEGKGWSCNIVICKDETAIRPITTCADKARVLLTSEDGKKHCIKF